MLDWQQSRTNQIIDSQHLHLMLAAKYSTEISWLCRTDWNPSNCWESIEKRLSTGSNRISLWRYEVF